MEILPSTGFSWFFVCVCLFVFFSYNDFAVYRVSA